MTEREVYLTLIKFRLQIFAVAFSRDVTVSYQFGNNRLVFSDPAIGCFKANEVGRYSFLRRLSGHNAVWHEYSDVTAAHDDLYLSTATLLSFVVAFSAFTYVMLDGLDLVVQLLVPSFSTPRPRCEMDNEVSVWKGNETLLVLGAGRAICSLSAGLCGADACVV